MKTRIDIICGYPGSGKSALIRQMTASSVDCGRVIHFEGGADITNITAARIAQLIHRDRPDRILLESSADPNALHQLFTSHGLASQAYAGAQAIVIGAVRFLNEVTAEREYAETHLHSVDIVLVNHAATLPVRDTLAILTRVWELNQHIHVAVEPYQGIDLWKILDLPSARVCEKTSEQTYSGESGTKHV